MVVYEDTCILRRMEMYIFIQAWKKQAHLNTHTHTQLMMEHPATEFRSGRWSVARSFLTCWLAGGRWSLQLGFEATQLFQPLTPGTLRNHVEKKE